MNPVRTLWCSKPNKPLQSRMFMGRVIRSCTLQDCPIFQCYCPVRCKTLYWTTEMSGTYSYFSKKYKNIQYFLKNWEKFFFFNLKTKTKYFNNLNESSVRFYVLFSNFFRIFEFSMLSRHSRVRTPYLTEWEIARNSHAIIQAFFSKASFELCSSSHSPSTYYLTKPPVFLVLISRQTWQTRKENKSPRKIPTLYSPWLHKWASNCSQSFSAPIIQDIFKIPNTKIMYHLVALSTINAVGELTCWQKRKKRSINITEYYAKANGIRT